MRHDTPVRGLSATQYPSEAEIADWIEITEAIALLDMPSIRNWIVALNDRFGSEPEARKELWSRLSDECYTSLKAVKGGVA